MKQIRWDVIKSGILKKTRGVSFEELIQAELIAVKRHPQRKNQKIILFRFKGYIWVVPFVESNGDIFLKTLFPSRKFTKLYNKEGLS